MERTEVIKALELHSEGDARPCVDECPYGDMHYCGSAMATDALSLIKELTEDIEWSAKRILEADKKVAELTEVNERLKGVKEEYETFIGTLIPYDKLIADTVKKMQTEIEARCIKGGIYPAFVKSTIDKIAKEMIGGADDKED